MVLSCAGALNFFRKATIFSYRMGACVFVHQRRLMQYNMHACVLLRKVFQCIPAFTPPPLADLQSSLLADYDPPILRVSGDRMLAHRPDSFGEHDPGQRRQQTPRSREARWRPPPPPTPPPASSLKYVVTFVACVFSCGFVLARIYPCIGLHEKPSILSSHKDMPTQ